MARNSLAGKLHKWGEYRRVACWAVEVFPVPVPEKATHTVAFYIFGALPQAYSPAWKTVFVTIPISHAPCAACITVVKASKMQFGAWAHLGDSIRFLAHL